MSDECCGSGTPDSPYHEDTEFADAVKELAKHEKRILSELSTPEATAEFLEHPARVLRRLRIPVPAAVAHRLRLPTANRVEDVAAQPVILPNGQTITPKVRVRIVGRER